jgi:hypothetical protein
MDLARKWHAISLVSMAVNARVSTITWSEVTSVDQLVDLGYERVQARIFIQCRPAVLLRIDSWECVIVCSCDTRLFEDICKHASNGSSILFKKYIMLIVPKYIDNAAYTDDGITSFVYHNNILQVHRAGRTSIYPTFVIPLSEFHKLVRKIYLYE